MSFDPLLPFQFLFMQNAFAIAVIVAIPTALLSCFLVLKGWALMGDAVSHAVLPGVVLAWILKIPLIVGAFGAGMTCALLTGYLSHNSRVKRDTVMGVVFSGMFAVGIVMYTAITTNEHLDHVLFGNMLGVGSADLLTSLAISLLVSAALLAKWKDFLLHAFDPAQARVSGLSTGLLHYGMLAMLSLTIVATLSSVGIILAVGLLIAPGAIAFLLVRSFGAMMLVAVLVTIAAMLAGTYLSFFIDSAPAPTIVLMLTGAFVVAFVRRDAITRVNSMRAAVAASRQADAGGRRVRADDAHGPAPPARCLWHRHECAILARMVPWRHAAAGIKRERGESDPSRDSRPWLPPQL